MALISVILPTCDRFALVPRAVASVLAQNEPDFELLLIDNNRRESNLTAHPDAGNWLADPRVRIIRPPVMRSAATARNAGLAVAQGEWVSYLDDDDAWRPEKLRRQLELARITRVPLVLCGATYHLHCRVRRVQCDADEWRGDDLILRARWNTPLLFHRRLPLTRFDESLSPGEDAEFAHRLLAEAGAECVPNVPEPLVDIYPQHGPRVNANPVPVRAAAARILALRGRWFSRGARRRYVLQTLLVLAKLQGRPLQCAALGCRLMRESRGADWRAVANALAVSLRLQPGRWVS